MLGANKHTVQQPVPVTFGFAAQCFSRRTGIYGAGLSSSQAVASSSNTGAPVDGTDPQFWRQSGLQLGGKDTNQQQRLDYAPASDTEALLKKLAAVATVSGERCGLQLDQ